MACLGWAQAQELCALTFPSWLGQGKSRNFPQLSGIVLPLNLSKAVCLKGGCPLAPPRPAAKICFLSSVLRRSLNVAWPGWRDRAREASFSQHRNMGKKPRNYEWKVPHTGRTIKLSGFIIIINIKLWKKGYMFPDFLGVGGRRKYSFNRSFIKILEWKFLYSCNNECTCICL